MLRMRWQAPVMAGRLQGQKGSVYTGKLLSGKQHQAQTGLSYLSLAEEVIRHEPESKTPEYS